MPLFISPALQLVGRILLAVIFIKFGFGKISAPAGSIAYITHVGFPVPTIAYGVSVLIEFGGGLAILFGLLTRTASLALAIFCVVTAVIVHLPVGDAPNMLNFYKNLAMAGGFLQLTALGAGAWSLDAWLARKRS